MERLGRYESSTLEVKIHCKPEALNPNCLIQKLLTQIIKFKLLCAGVTALSRGSLQQLVPEAGDILSCLILRFRFRVLLYIGDYARLQGSVVQLGNKE